MDEPRKKQVSRPNSGVFSRYYPEVNVARGIGLLFVILGHSFPDADVGISNYGVLWCRAYLYTFHMALFFSLSGFVSSNRLLEGNYSVAGEAKKKALRLLVP